MSHCHAHHASTNARYQPAFLIAIVANGVFVILQCVFAYFAHSTSLLADAVHNFGDVLGLAVSWIANRLLLRSPTTQTTYGMKKLSILAAFINGVLLVFSCGVIVSEAIYKLYSPVEVKALPVIVIASLGILINGLTAMLFIRGTEDLNVRSAFLHLAYDALISLGVVLSAIFLYFTHWWFVDPLMGLLLAVIILKGTWSLFVDSFRLIIDAVPRQISWSAVRTLFEQYPGVEEIHDLHIWALSTRENALSVHLYMPNSKLSDKERAQLVVKLKNEHDIHHSTIQVEHDLNFCEDACKPSLIDNIQP